MFQRAPAPSSVALPCAPGPLPIQLKVPPVSSVLAAPISSEPSAPAISPIVISWLSATRPPPEIVSAPLAPLPTTSVPFSVHVAALTVTLPDAVLPTRA
jgi:hypothetical protein